MGVRTMDDLDAADIAAGQLWRREVTDPRNRLTFLVVDVDRDNGRVVLRRDPFLEREVESVSFGSLLTEWLLVGEAG